MTIPADVIWAAQASQAKWKVPASICIAQWALESSYGQHMPPDSHNPFGIKAAAGQPFVMCMTTEHINGRDIRVAQNFRKFDTLTDAFDLHGKLLATSHYYATAMTMVDDPNSFAHALTGVYATDPKYGVKLITIMKAQNLYQYDKHGG